MTREALALLLLSTATHAVWNLLLKRASGGHIFVGLSKACEVAIFAPVFFWLAGAAPALSFRDGYLVGVGALLVLINYAALARAYAVGDLTVVYPLARGGALMLLPALGFVVYGEELGAQVVSGMSLIVGGIVLLPLADFSAQSFATIGSHWRSAGMANAALAAAAAALYTIWDKYAVRTMPLFQYFYLYTAIVAIVYCAVVWRKNPWAVVRAEWRAHRTAIVSVGVLNTTSYVLVLVALRSGTTSIVVAVRQLSIAWGLVLGWSILREPVRPPKLLGGILVMSGCALAAWSRQP